MTFKGNFCPSPWFHMRINSLGQFEYCRWALRDTSSAVTGDPVTFFKKGMAPIRQLMVEGKEVPGCANCNLMNAHSKVSGRDRQLLKIGVRSDLYEKTFASSPWLDEFKRTDHNDGIIDLMPQDWQIDLGNLCNSACIFCHPYSSSRLGVEWKKLGIVKNINNSQWTNNPDTVATIIDTLIASPRIAYIHFIGGELVINPAFKRILTALIDAGLHEQISIGFTTGMTDWDDELVESLTKFKEVNMGLSIECLDPLNDYIRYPSTISSVKQIMDKWLAIAEQYNWLTQLRITPTILSIDRLIPLFDFALAKGTAIESCNFISDPAFMSPAVLPPEYRAPIIKELSEWLLQHENQNQPAVINTRNPAASRQQVIEDAASYLHFLTNQPDESHLLPELVKRLKLLESNRSNSILDYTPKYAQLFRDTGY